VSIGAAVGLAEPSSRPASSRKTTVDGLVIQGGQADLLEVVLTLDAGGGLAHLLNCRPEKADQHGDDADDDEQLNQGEPRVAPRSAVL
jgi:hypothetical protein